MDRTDPQTLLSVPPNMARCFADTEGRPLPDWFATCDPPGGRVGSGGGSLHLLREAWRSTGAGMSFSTWLRSRRKLLIHGGGQSRRVPAYAPAGKIFTPMPVWRWSVGQRLGQELLDLQVDGYRRIFRAAERGAVMITSGDVLLRFDVDLPPFPHADVLCMGLWVSAEEASHFGVFFCPRENPAQLAFFRHKPTPAEIRELATDYLFMVDTGVWILSESALDALIRRCGGEGIDGTQAGTVSPYDLYGEMGPALGACPTQPDPGLSGLTSAVVPLPHGEFYHFGTSRDLILSNCRLQNIVQDQTQLSIRNVKPHPSMFVQNALVEVQLQPENHTLWIENSHIPRGWSLACEHVLTGVPRNDWHVGLRTGVCLDFVPVDEGGGLCVRAYGIDDRFRGAVGDPGTKWFGASALSWFSERGLALGTAGIDPGLDIQAAPLFPVFGESAIDSAMLSWLTTPPESPGTASEQVRAWLAAERLSADQLGERANLRRLYRQRSQFMGETLPLLAANHRRSVFYKLDLADTASTYARCGAELPGVPDTGDAIVQANDHMFRAAVLRTRGLSGHESEEQEAFASLQRAVTAALLASEPLPERTVLEDQIVWARSPVRLDLAGGWSDTPPYCLIHGGSVTNLAVDLNGQPPIQVFVRVCERPEVVLRSIDLGVEERVSTYAGLEDYARVGSGFSIPKAALCLSGFTAKNGARLGARSLEQHLRQFGGGLEISLVVAVPKGSGLGTSSILAATVLGALSEVCGLNWGVQELVVRTLALEQMLTTGGGWQDQAGGILHGIKLVETQPGLVQRPMARWLPEDLFTAPDTKRCLLLYYTGITRVAKGILQEIVRGMFLNSTQHLAIVDEIAAHAHTTFDVIQRADWDGLCRAVDTSWYLNRILDSGTCPPAVEALLAEVEDWLAAGKLLGAGGGGYMLMLAKDTDAAARIREKLTREPPNSKARFVDLDVSRTGLQVTRS